MPSLSRASSRFLAALPLVALVIVTIALALLQTPVSRAHHLCGNTGSPHGPFDLQTYEASDYRNTYARAFELAGHNQLLHDRPGFALPPMEIGDRSAGSGVHAAGFIPPVLLKSIAHIESNWSQANYDVPYGAVGAVLSSHDCGYGLTQVTSGMQNVSGVPNLDQAMIGGHYAFNIARGAKILADKWNAAPEFRPVVGLRTPQAIEDWYYALWGYNGFAFKNHPLNPDFAWPRPMYDCNSARTYPYQELVIGCVNNPPSRSGARLWNPQEATLPNLSDPAFFDRMKLENWAPCSQSFQCAPMDIPTPSPWHTDPYGSPFSRSQVIGEPVVITSTGSISLVAPSGGQSPNAGLIVGNGGSGVLSWRLQPTAPWIRVSRIQGVALGADLGYRDSPIVVAADVSSLYPGRHTAHIIVESLYAHGAGRAIEVTVETADGELISTPGGHIYVLQGGLKRHVPDFVTFEAHGYTPSHVEAVPAEWANGIPSGHPIPSVLGNGRLLRSGSAIFIMENGAKRHVTGPQVLTQCGYGSDYVGGVSASTANTIPNGPPLTSPPCPQPSLPNGTLLGASDGSVWVVQWNSRRWVVGPGALSNCGYHWGNLSRLGDGTLAQLPVGPPLSSCTAEGSLLWTQDGRVNLVSGGALRHIPDPLTFELSGQDWGRVAPAGALALPRGEPLIPLGFTGHLIRQPDANAATFVIEGGTKRHVADANVFNACGYSWAAVSVLSSGAVNSIPAGPPLQGAPCPALTVPFGTLLQQRNGAVWVTLGNSRKWVASPHVFGDCGYQAAVTTPAINSLLAGLAVSGPVHGCTADGSALTNRDGKVFFVRSGSRRHLPNPATLEALGISWSSVTPTPDGWLPAGKSMLDVAATGRLVRAPGDGVPVYVMDAGKKRHVFSPAVLASCGYSWDAVTTLSVATIGSFQEGSPVTGSACPRVSFPDGTLLQQRNGAVWVVQGNQRRWISGPAAFTACGYRWSDVDAVADSILAALPQATSLGGPPCP